MYKIIFSQGAEKEFLKLDKQVQERIIRAFTKLLINPKRNLEKLVGLPYYKLRISDYRLIIKLDEQNQIINIMKVGHRKNIYKEL